MRDGAGEPASAGAVAAGGISRHRHAATTMTRAPIPSWWRAIWRRWTRRPRLQRHADLVLRASGPGPGGRDLPAGARSGFCRCAGCRKRWPASATARRSGWKDDFPAEIAPLAAELNSLIEHSAEVVARARTHVSNLAHFLKTPLSVLASEAEAARSGARRWRIRCSARWITMRRQVDHYLARARAAGSVNVLGNRTQVAPVLDDLARVLARIHAARGIVIDADCPRRSLFPRRAPGPGRDGGQSDRQCLQMGRAPGAGARVQRRRAGWSLTVEDDGPGLSAEERSRVGERGERLDESVPGSGLGLAIVRDISKLYGGFFALGTVSTGRAGGPAGTCRPFIEIHRNRTLTMSRLM